MSFPQGDRYWLNTYKFVKQHVQTQNRIVAPKEFKEKLNNVTDYISSKNQEVATSFQWIILHKGRLDELKIEFLYRCDRFLKPVYANEVFIVFSSCSHLPELTLKSVHVQSFREKIIELIKKNTSDRNHSQSASIRAVYLGNNIALTKTIYSHKLYVDTRDLSLTPHLILDGYWESWISNFFLNIVKPGMRVVDVGANVGYYSLLAASQIGTDGFVYSFEANPQIYSLLRRNLEINGFSSTSKCINKAVTNLVGTVDFKVLKEYFGSSYINHLPRQEELEYESEIIEIKSTSLDSELGSNKLVDLLKIDAEGAEPLIIEGAADLLKTNQNIKIILEFDLNNFKDNDKAYQYLKLLQDFGFKLHSITEDSQIKPIQNHEIIEQPKHYELFLFR